MISDSENVLTAVVVGVAVEEAVALIHADQDQGRLHHIVGTRDRLRDDEEIHRAETRRHAATETCMFQEEEEVVGQVMVGTGQFRDRRRLEAVDTAGAQVQVVEVNAVEDQRRDQSLAQLLVLSVARHQDQGHLPVDENLPAGYQGHLHEVGRLLRG